VLLVGADQQWRKHAERNEGAPPVAVEDAVSVVAVPDCIMLTVDECLVRALHVKLIDDVIVLRHELLWRAGIFFLLNVQILLLDVYLILLLNIQVFLLDVDLIFLLNV